MLCLALSSACQKESVEGDVCAVNYSVRVADAVATRASGQVQTAVNELVYEVYRTAGEKVQSFTDADKLLYRGTAEIRGGVANFSLNHAKIHNLTVLFHRLVLSFFVFVLVGPCCPNGA